MIRVLSLLAVLTLAGCTPPPPPEPIVVIKEVKVPVAVACVPADFPSAPVFIDTNEALIAAPDAAARYQLMAQGRLERIGRVVDLEVVVEGCRL